MQQLANSSPDLPAALPRKWVKEIFKRMGGLYGAKFMQLWGGVPESEQEEIWAQELADLGGDEIAVGLNACRTREWPPTLPEFLKLCRPWMNPEVAFHEAVKGAAARRNGEMGHWPHPAIYWAAITTGTHDLLNSTYSTMKARWEKSFGDEMAKRHWPPIPEVREALPAPGKTMATREEAETALKAMGADKALARPKGKDQKAWAQKILDEHERKGGQRYSVTVVAMARRAVESIGDRA